MWERERKRMVRRKKKRKGNKPAAPARRVRSASVTHTPVSVRRAQKGYDVHTHTLFPSLSPTRTHDLCMPLYIDGRVCFVSLSRIPRAPQLIGVVRLGCLGEGTFRTFRTSGDLQDDKRLRVPPEI